MKIPNSTKTVEYFGLTLEVPSDTRWIVTNSSGDIMVSTRFRKPVIYSNNRWVEKYYFLQIDLELLTKIDKAKIEGDWKQSLVKVK